MNLEGLPPLTTVWAGGAVFLSLLEKFGFVTEYQIGLSVRSIVEKQQYWRLVTTFMYFGPFNINLFIKLFFYLRFAIVLELDAYVSRRRAEFFWLFFVSSLSVLLLSSVIPMQFLSEPLSFVLLYVWCRRNRHVRVNIFGLLVFNAPYLPFLELGISMVRSWAEALPIALGIALGHTCLYSHALLTRRRIFDCTMAQRV